jgi:N6-adenosine-specific RNA methylase IME4
MTTAGGTHGSAPIRTTWGTTEVKYRTIVADPPWRYEQPGVTKADARRFYATLSVGEICGQRDLVLPLAEDDAHLWLWTTNALIEESYDVVRAWGFRPLTLLTWCKPQPGVGNYLRNNTEHCILSSRGAPMTPETKAIASWYIWPRKAHSQKPEAFYDLVEQVSPAPRLELFARRQRLGWDTWGDEALNHVDSLALP